MSQVESPLGALDIESAARHEWLSWTKMADVEREAPPVLVGGDGPYVIESDGTRLLDAMSGLFTTAIGYSYGKELGAAAAAQMERLAYYPNWAATNPATLALTERILALAPSQMSRVFFTSGGSESVESAGKLARQHFQARGESSRRIVISRNGSYHGCSLGALSITGIAGARAPFEPLLADTRHVINTDPRQNPGGDPLAAADAIEEAILAAGAENVCMVIVEPVQNAGGTLVPPPGYAQRVREICDRHGVLLACDEVICAFGRLGHWFGSARLGFEPDLITFAKAVTSGYAPLGGVIFSERVAEPLLEAEGLYAHGYTFGGHPVSCAVALGNLAIMERLDVNANVLEVEPYLESVLNDVAAASPIVVEARGCGFFRSFEFTDAALVDRVCVATRDRGVITRTDVRANPCLAISPPLICDRSHVDELAEALAGGLAEIAG
jgi:adenosylmethionine-8-amino-7-oxononanoate aminotransferase